MKKEIIFLVTFIYLFIYFDKLQKPLPTHFVNGGGFSSATCLLIGQNGAWSPQVGPRVPFISSLDSALCSLVHLTRALYVILLILLL